MLLPQLQTDYKFVQAADQRTLGESALSYEYTFDEAYQMIT